MGIIHIILITVMAMAVTMILTGVMVAATPTTATAVVITRLITMTDRAIMCHAGEVTALQPGDHIQPRVTAEANQLYPLRALTQEGAGQHHLLLHLQHRLHSPEQAQQPGGLQMHLRKAHIQGLHQFRTAG